MNASWDGLNVSENEFFVLGEIHGIQENISILESIIDYISMTDEIILALEWPSELSAPLNDFLKNGSLLNYESWKFCANKDGRISKEHIDFIKKLKNTHSRVKEIHGVSATANSWEERDKLMGQNILDLKRDNQNKKIVCILGNFHATKRPFEFEGNRMTPAASYLPADKTISIKLVYLSGKFMNVEIKNIIPPKETPPLSQLNRLISPNSPGFDFELAIDAAHPTSPVID